MSRRTVQRALAFNTLPSETMTYAREVGLDKNWLLLAKVAAEPPEMQKAALDDFISEKERFAEYIAHARRVGVPSS